MKLVALAITLVLWFGVTGLSRPTTQRLTSIPLDIKNYSNNIEITNSPIQEVNLVISGDSRRLAQINARDLVASINVSEVLPGDRVVQLTPETVYVPLPTGVKLDEIQPARIALRIESVEQKDVPVTPEIVGELPVGYELYGHMVNPPRVNVRGPASFIRSLESISTERFDLTNRVADFTARQIPISVSNAKATLSESVVDVSFRIGEKRIERIFMIPLADGSGRRARVVLYGGRSVLDELEVTDVVVEVYRGDAGRDAVRVKLAPETEGIVEIRSAELRG